MPPEHDGTSVFTFELRFSEEPPELSVGTVRDSLLSLTGGTVKRAPRVTRGSNLAFRVHVEPAGLGAVTVAFKTPPPCGLPHSVCTADGRALAGIATATIPGPASLSVVDAEAREGAGAVLEFTVTLSRARHEATTVDYATSDGTATAGEDYTAASGTLSFAAGETEKTVSVALLDDAHDDDGETLTLTLSNPRPPETVRLGDATATGTIRNSDPAQRAWLARFGRTAADQVVDAVQARMEAGAGAETHLTLASERVGLDGDANRASLAEWEANARLAAMSDPLGGDGWESRGWNRDDPERDRAVTGRELLTGSSFLLRLNAADDGTEPATNAPAWTLWGRGALTSFSGSEDDLTLDGEVASAMVGIDRSGLMLTLGLIASHSRAEGEYREGSDGGELESALTGLYPYGSWEVNERLSLWGVAGYGEGELTMTQEGGQRYEADLDLAMAAVGARAVVVEPGAEGGLELAVKPDALGLRTTSEAALGSEGGLMSAADAGVTRLRLGLEGTWRGAGALVPTVELALRHDGGDAETGLGVEVGGGLAFSNPSSGLKAGLTGRALVAHADDDFREWGIGGSLALDPGAQGRGLSFALRPAWGAEASAAERLLGGDPLSNLAANDTDEPGGRLDAELGYGLPVFGGQFTGTPHAGFTLGDSEREFKLGWRLAPVSRNGFDFDLGLEATRREAANDDAAPVLGIGLKLNARF